MALSIITFANESAEKYKELTDVYTQNQGTDYNKVLPTAFELLTISQKENDTYHEIRAFLMLAYIHAEINDFGKAVIYYLEGIRISDEFEHPDLENAKIALCKNLANILSEYKMFELAEDFYLKADAYARRYHKTNQIISITLNRLNVGLITDEQSSKHNLYVLDTLEKQELDEATKIRIANMKGMCYESLKDTTKSILSYKNALTYDPKAYPSNYFNAARNLSLHYLENNKTEEAEFYLNIAAGTIDLITIAQKETQQLYLRTRAKLLALQNNPEAENVFLNAVALTDSTELDYKSLDIYKEISQFYSSIGNTKNAVVYTNKYFSELEKFVERQNTLSEEDKKHNIALLTQRYFDVIEANKSKANAIRTAQISSISIISVLSLVILYMLYQKHSTKQSIKKALLDIELNSEV